jgi:hypothetical protein
VSLYWSSPWTGPLMSTCMNWLMGLDATVHGVNTLARPIGRRWWGRSCAPRLRNSSRNCRMRWPTRLWLIASTAGDSAGFELAAGAPVGWLPRLIVLLDGDRARDFGKPNRPIRPDPDVRAGLKRMDEARVDRRILMRYAFENYFSRGAFESVVGAQPVGVFPLDETRAVSDQITGYSKSMNDRLAAATALPDLNATDLVRVPSRRARQSCLRLPAPRRPR